MAIFQKFSAALKSVYSGISGIVTVAAAVAVGICSLGMILAKNQKTVEEFKAWRTRVFITWIVFFMLGAIVTFGEELTSGMNFEG